MEGINIAAKLLCTTPVQRETERAPKSFRIETELVALPALDALALYVVSQFGLAVRR